MRYVGQFRNGLYHGKGFLVDSELKESHGEFYDDKLVGI